MSRRPNANKPIRLAIVLVFRPAEMRMWKWNEPSAAGNLGGYPRFENHLIGITDPRTGICSLGAEDFLRMTVYCQKQDTGGPNARIRSTCIPALRRAGIDLLPDWRAPSNNTERKEETNGEGSDRSAGERGSAPATQRASAAAASGARSEG